jgi:hypothetical protein
MEKRNMVLNILEDTQKIALQEEVEIFTPVFMPLPKKRSTAYTLPVLLEKTAFGMISSLH